MSGNKGVARRTKKARPDPTEQEEDRIDGLIAQALDYLEKELQLLIVDPGNFGEVTRIARALQQLRPPKHEVPAAPGPEANFQWSEVDDEESD